GELRDDSLLGDALAYQLGERPRLQGSHRRGQRADLPAHGGDDGGRRGESADLEVGAGREAAQALRGGDVEAAGDVAPQVVVTQVLDHADDFERRGFGTGEEIADVVAKGIAAGEKLLSHGFIDDADGSGRGGVLARDLAAAEDGNAERGKIIGADLVEAGSGVSFCRFV